MKKKLKIILIVTICAAAVVLAVVAIALNYHNIYMFSETRGWFRHEIAVRSAEDVKCSEYSIDSLLHDSRVSFEQSLMLVNTENMLPSGFIADVIEYKDTDVYMNSCMLDSYAKLSAAVKDRTRNKLYVSSDFRSAAEQQALYLEDPLTATLPGASEHQTGLALDVYVAYYSGDGFIRSPSGRFVNSHAHEYGFIIRYPSYAEDITGIRYEPWHIRYVGHPHADVIYNNHTTLEEYIEGLDVGQWYEIEGYLVSRQRMADEKLLLPERFTSCVVSPDNTGNYIVTVECE